MEWTPKLLKLKGSNPKLVLEMFINNDYIISTNNFFIKDNISINKFVKIRQTNIYFTYKHIMK